MVVEAPTIVAEGASIVMLGRFNPSIVTPAWLEWKGLLGPGEAETVTEQVIVPGTTIFKLPSFRCEVTEDRLALTGEDPLEYARLRDLAVGVLDILPETPLAVVGMNRYVHYGIPDQVQWDALGDLLAPKELWTDAMHLPGLRSMTVEGSRQDGFHGVIRVRVEPSNVHPQAVFIEHNDHVVLERTDHSNDTREQARESIAEIKGFEPSYERVPLAREVVDTKYLDSIEEGGRVADYLVSLIGRSS